VVCLVAIWHRECLKVWIVGKANSDEDGKRPIKALAFDAYGTLFATHWINRVGVPGDELGIAPGRLSVGSAVNTDYAQVYWALAVGKDSRFNLASSIAKSGLAGNSVARSVNTSRAIPSFISRRAASPNNILA
jgi:hypothetical protein